MADGRMPEKSGFGELKYSSHKHVGPASPARATGCAIIVPHERSCLYTTPLFRGVLFLERSEAASQALL